MELKLNEKLLFNVQLLLANMHNHAILSFNMNKLKSELSANFNALVLPNRTHKLTFNNMVLPFLMLLLSFNKLVPLVLWKILYVHLIFYLFVFLKNHLIFIFVVTTCWCSSCWFQCRLIWSRIIIQLLIKSRRWCWFCRWWCCRI
jgi:hypothetical protein